MKPITEVFKIDWTLVAQLDLPDDVQGWNSDYSIFDRLVVETSAVVVIEVGSWKGRSAIHIARALLALGSEWAKKHPEGFRAVPRLYCVDTWQGGIDHILSDLPQDAIPRGPLGESRLYCQFLWNIHRAGFGSIVQPLPMPSITGAKMLRAQGIEADLIYVDASHEHEDVYQDLRSYWHVLRPGGLMFGDDIAMPGVFGAVARFMAEAEIAKATRIDPFWTLQKPT